jgi:hypothetical protein
MPYEVWVGNERQGTHESRALARYHANHVRGTVKAVAGSYCACGRSFASRAALGAHVGQAMGTHCEVPRTWEGKLWRCACRKALGSRAAVLAHCKDRDHWCVEDAISEAKARYKRWPREEIKARIAKLEAMLEAMEG